MEMTSLITAISGFFAGSIIVRQFLRWIALLSVVTSKQGGDFLGPPRRRLLWAAPFVVFVHPGMYAISALLAITAFWLLNRLSSEWGWFLVGSYTYITVTGMSVVSRYRRLRRK